jgi:hypothetical protein
VDDVDIDRLLDDFVFEPNCWDLASAIGIGVDPERDPQALDELADAMRVWCEGPELERLTDEAVERVWDDELAGMVREGIVRLGTKEGGKRARPMRSRSSIAILPARKSRERSCVTSRCSSEAQTSRSSSASTASNTRSRTRRRKNAGRSLCGRRFSGRATRPFPTTSYARRSLTCWPRRRRFVSRP